MIDQEQLHKIERRFAEIEAKMAALSSQGHSRELQQILEEHARLKPAHEAAARYLKLLHEREQSQALLDAATSDEAIKALAQADVDQIDSELPRLEKIVLSALLPPDPHANRNIIMEIRAGTGGEEAALFAADLLRMYMRYAEKKGWKASLLDASPSNIGGYKEVILSIEGSGVYCSLRFESGTHRVQRIPATEASGRIHTSAATVAVLPEAAEIDEIEIKPEDLRIDVYRSSGAGGQHVNTTDSAVRITHLETGIVAQSQDERSQHRNREKALRVLKARLLDHVRQREQTRAADSRRSQIGSGDRSERIRTYNFPQNRVTDHRINLTLYHLDQVMEGELDELTEALREHDMEERLGQSM